MYYFFVCRAHSKLKDNPKVFSSPLGAHTAKQASKARCRSFGRSCNNEWNLHIFTYTQHLKPSLFSYSQPHELPFARGILRLYTHTHRPLRAAPAESERKRRCAPLLAHRRGAVLKTYFLLSSFETRCVPQISPSQVFA
jgi:hypothetical protein